MAVAVIVGAGASGTSAALALREVGWTGPIHLIGDEQYVPYDRRLLSKPGKSKSATLRSMVTADQLKSAEINLCLGIEVIKIDRLNKVVHLADGGECPYDKLLLALGSAPVIPKCIGSEQIRSISSFDDARWLTTAVAPDCRVLIVGAGFVGLELGATLRSWGADVTIVELRQHVLRNLAPAAISDRIVSTHCREGIDFRFGQSVRSVDGPSVTLGDGSILGVDLVIAAIGSKPKSKLAVASGLRTDGGIIVNRQFQSSDKSIYAAGDCSVLSTVEGVEYQNSSGWMSAIAQGESAAKCMVGSIDEPRREFPLISRQYDFELQIAGHTRNDDEFITREGIGSTAVFGFSRDCVLTGVSGWGDPQETTSIIEAATPLIGRRFGPLRYRLADRNVNFRKLLRTSRKSSGT